MVMNRSRSALVRELRGPASATRSVFTLGNRLAIVSGDNQLYSWDWNDLSKWPIVAKPANELITAIAPDRVIYLPSGNKSALVAADLTTAKEIKRIVLPLKSICSQIIPSANGQFVAINLQQDDQTILALVNSQLNLSNTIKLPEKDLTIFRVAVSNDGKLLAAAGKTKKAWLAVADVNSGQILRQKQIDEFERFDCLAFSPDGKTIYAAEKIRFILAFDISTGEIIKRFEIPIYETPSNQKQNTSAIIVSPDGKILAADTEPARTIWFWDIATGEKIGTICAADKTVSDIAFSPDGSMLASGCLVRPEIRIWKVPQIDN